MPHFDASAATGGKGSKQGGKGARDISTIEGSQQTLSQIANSGRDDQLKYQYAVDLARQDLGGDTSDTDEFRNLVDDYYVQMDPETSAEDMRGETGFTQAVRAVGETYDNVNDLLGDGIDWLWDNTAGNVAGGLGGLIGAFANDDELGEKWKQGVSDVVSDDTADAIASMGTGMLVSAIPGIGVPLSIGLTAAQHSDDLYEALAGRDAVTRERLSDTERLGRAGSAILDTALAAAPAIGKAGRIARGSQAADDALDAATRLDDLKFGGSDDILESVTKLEGGTGDAADAARVAAAASGDTLKARSVIDDLLEQASVADRANADADDLAAFAQEFAVSGRDKAVDDLMDQAVLAERYAGRTADDVLEEALTKSGDEAESLFADAVGLEKLDGRTADDLLREAAEQERLGNEDVNALLRETENIRSRGRNVDVDATIGRAEKIQGGEQPTMDELVSAASRMEPRNQEYADELLDAALAMEPPAPRPAPSRNFQEFRQRAADFGNRAGNAVSSRASRFARNQRSQRDALLDSLRRNGANKRAQNVANSLSQHVRPTNVGSIKAGRDAVAALDEGAGWGARQAARFPAMGQQFLSNRMANLRHGGNSTPGMLGGFIGSIPLSYFNYMSETGDANLETLMGHMTNPANIAMLLAPGVLRHTPGVRNLYGTLGLQGRGSNPSKPAGSVRARGIGNNIQSQPDDAYGDEEFQRRIRMAGGDA